jgi:alpha-acetolactate decarboxylase
MSFDQGTVSIDYTDNFEMLLPQSDYFTSTDFSIDRSEDVRRAETNE